MDLELALFSSSNNTCNGTLSLERSAYDPVSFNEEISGTCLLPNKRYWLMVDGQTDNVKGAFKLQLSDMGSIQTVFPASATVCNGDSYQVGTSSYSTAGVYQDTFLLNNFCDSIVITDLTVLDPLSFDLIEIQEATAFGVDDAHIDLQTSGGTGLYSVTWDNGAVGSEQSGLTGGDTYCFTITDDFGCILEDCVEAPYNSDIVPVITLQEVQCFGDDSGVINVAAFNGIAPYTVDLVFPDGTDSTFTLPGNNIGFDIFGLSAGLYNCTISDVNGSINFDIDLLQNDEIGINLINEIPITCFGACDGLVEFAATGGFAPYFYDWETGGNQGEESNLCAGTYGLTVTDFFGCVNVFEVVVTEPDSIDGYIDLLSDVDCKGGSDGSLLYQTTDPDLLFEWSNGVTTALNEDIVAGNYELTITDSDACFKVIQQEVSEPPLELGLDFEEVNAVSCFGKSDGILSAIVIGGNGAYQYDWSNGLEDALIFDLPAGVYTLSVTDEKGCFTEGTFELIQPDSLVAVLEKKNIECTDEDFGGRVDVISVQGGVEPYLYSIDGFYFDENSSFQMLGPGSYTTYVKDINDCVWSELVTIESPELIEAFIGDDVVVDLGDDVQVDLFVNQSNITIDWFFDGEDLDCPSCYNLTFQPLQSGVLEVVVLDLNTNCSSSDEINVELKENLDLYFPNSFSPNNDGINDVFYPFNSKDVRSVKTFAIYDRYGQELHFRENFNAGDAAFGWDGKFQGRSMGQGVYTFMAVIEYINGKEVLFKGGISLIR